MSANQDFKELLSALSEAGAEFIVVGAHAVMFYTVPRYTKDFDVWVRPTPANAARVHAALVAFGAPMADLTVGDLATPEVVFQIGVEPNRIDILTTIDGVSFDEAWPKRTMSTYDGVAVALLGIEELIKNKRAVGRPEDEIDVRRLEQSLTKGGK